MSKQLSFPDFTYTFEYINPEKAREYLKINYEKNRRMRPGYLNNYEYMIMDDQWTDFQADAPIVFIDTDNGERLASGQHRLTALSKMDDSKSVGFVVVRHVPEFQYETIDNGKSREAQDYVEGKNKSISASIASKCIALERGFGLGVAISGARKNGKSSLSVSRMEIAEKANTDQFVSEAATLASYSANWIKGATSRVMSTFIVGVHYAFNGEQDDILNEFLHQLKSESPDSDVIFSLYKRMSTLFKKDSQKPSEAVLIGTMIHAFECYKECKAPGSWNQHSNMFSKYDKLIKENTANKVKVMS